MPSVTEQTQPDAYRFDRFRAIHAMRDIRFSRSSVRPGETFPDVEVITLEGEAIRASDLIGDKPAVIVTGSLTCPMTISSLPELRKLADELAGDVEFVLLYTREAHPGEHYPQPHTIENKIDHARAMRDVYDLSWPVVVDDVDGTLHERLDSQPNTVYVVSPAGEVLFRALWAGYLKPIDEALRQVVAGQRPRTMQSNAFVRPLLRAIGYVAEVIERAGPRAWRDLLVATPPMWLAGKAARGLSAVGKGKRGPVLTAAAAVLAILSVFGVLVV